MRWWRRSEREHDLERELRSDLELEVPANLRRFGAEPIHLHQSRSAHGWRSVADGESDSPRDLAGG